ncbi:MAG TPA: hypothetical protein PJ986_00090 [Gammaproteobacteria bacterium]|nr:hypothetical protein [Gammaproteobacteria bacterium]
MRAQDVRDVGVRGGEIDQRGEELAHARAAAAFVSRHAKRTEARLPDEIDRAVQRTAFAPRVQARASHALEQFVQRMAARGDGQR